MAQYCGKDCQKGHWQFHKKDCRSPLKSHTWQPDWALQNRRPTFIGDGPPAGFGQKKYVWGNVPALDILRLESNEGERYGEPLNLLFAASGDLRNVVKTVASLPESYEQRVRLVVNDRDLDIVARNLVLILIVFKSRDISFAVDCMIHLWYSALITEDHEKFLVEVIKPMIDKVNEKIEGKKSGSLQAKTWEFGTSTVRLVLSKEEWAALPAYVSMQPDLCGARALAIRTSVTAAADRKDYADRSLITKQPEHRICYQQFRQDGILLPFGYSRKAHVKPNVTLFQSGAWPMMDSADPLPGWDDADFMSIAPGLTANDIYGKLYGYLHAVFACFCRRVLETTVDFQLYNLNAMELSSHEEASSFARIETANIADGFYLGIAKTLFHLGKLLQLPSQNRHAVLTTLFINAVEEMHLQEQHGATFASELKRVTQYLPLRTIPRSEGDPSTVMMMAALPMVRDGDRYFDRYMQMIDFPEAGCMTGMRMKANNSTVAKWPMKLRLGPGDPDSGKEFKSMLASEHTGTERYCEWIRTAE